MKKAVAKLFCLRGQGLIPFPRVLDSNLLTQSPTEVAGWQLSVHQSSWVCLGEEVEEVTEACKTDPFL